MYFGTGTTSTDCFPAAIGCCKAVCYYCCCWGLTEKKMEYLMCKFSAPAEGRPFAFLFSLLCKLSKDLLVRIIISIGLPIVVGERTYDWHFFGSDSLWKSDFCIDWSILSSRCWFCCCISTTTATTDDPKKKERRGFEPACHQNFGTVHNFRSQCKTCSHSAKPAVTAPHCNIFPRALTPFKSP